MVLTLSDLEKVVLSPDTARRWGKDAPAVLSAVNDILTAKCSTCAYKRKMRYLQELLSRHGDSLPVLQKAQDNKNTRQACIDCTMKHLAQAYVLQGEFYAGYTQYLPLIEAHLTEAFDECPGDETVLKSSISECLRALQVDGEPQIPLKVCLSSYSGPQDDYNDIPIGGYSISDRDLSENLRKVPEDVLETALKFLKIPTENSNTPAERAEVCGALACASDILSRYSPRVTTVMRRRRLLYSGKCDKIDEKILICRDILHKIQDILSERGLKLGDFEEKPVDVVFPVGPDGSGRCHEELKIALRSLEKYALGLGEVFIVTNVSLSWLKNVHVIPYPDNHAHNKDANLIEKLLEACKTPDLSENFLFWCDDQALVMPYDLKKHVPTYNHRGPAAFDRNSRNNWHKRMCHTFDLIREKYGEIGWNWDSHVPQPINKNLFMETMGSINFRSLPGVCINTAYFGLNDEKPLFNQDSLKETYEKAGADVLLKKPFIGWNDRGYLPNLRGRLLNMFKNPSKYEK